MAIVNIIRNGGSDTYDMELFYDTSSGVDEDDEHDGDAKQGSCKEEDKEGQIALTGGG